ncbi:MAG: hypothetical protein ABL951_02590 [Alphaproteobacteria bacterium]
MDISPRHGLARWTSRMTVLLSSGVIWSTRRSRAAIRCKTRE